MYRELSDELLLFVKSVGYGIIMAVGYDMLRILRRVIHHRPFGVITEDLCYWIGSGFFLFSRIYIQNSGILRWYIFAGVLLGMVFVSRDVQPSSGVLCRKIFAVSRKDDIIFYKKVEILLFTM